MDRAQPQHNSQSLDKPARRPTNLPRPPRRQQPSWPRGAEALKQPEQPTHSPANQPSHPATPTAKTQHISRPSTQKNQAATGIEADPELVAAKQAAEAKPKTSRADRFQLHLAALAQFVEREGHARVPRTYKTGEGLSLRAWLNNTRARRDKLTAEQRGQLEALGVAL
ncbi:Helicase associated domain protein [Kitasatospora sp. NPDC059571]|uniref:Helicase associated domain protein n=1 Tax=Kitasatospora sp. NPDC059571 TaxID=3346871 RepID=UPI00367CE719